MFTNVVDSVAIFKRSTGKSSEDLPFLDLRMMSTISIEVGAPVSYGIWTEGCGLGCWRIRGVSVGGG